MTRRLAMLSVLGALAAGLGCQHVGGKCDCGAHPGDAAPPPLSSPYPTGPVPGVTTPAPIPPAASGAKPVAPETMPLTSLPK